MSIAEKLTAIAENVERVYSAGYEKRASNFWDSFQDFGGRTNYSYAFANWGHEKITPKYSIEADEMMYIFLNCGNLTGMSDVTITNTSDLPNMMYVCANCTHMTSPPQFIITAPIVKTYTAMYSNCNLMTNCSIYWGDGTADPVYERSSCQNMFFNCSSLTDIDFGNEETGSPIYLDLSWSERLSTESMESLLQSLKTIPEGSEGTYNITIAKNVYDTLSAEIISGFTAKGWTLIHKDRS